jgi:hypothetical protein
MLVGLAAVAVAQRATAHAVSLLGAAAWLREELGVSLDDVEERSSLPDVVRPPPTPRRGDARGALAEGHALPTADAVALSPLPRRAVLKRN